VAHIYLIAGEQKRKRKRAEGPMVLFKGTTRHHPFMFPPPPDCTLGAKPLIHGPLESILDSNYSIKFILVLFFI
jgi:hypothetical protein